MNRFLAFIFVCFAFSTGYCQDTLSIDDIYFHEDIAYKISNDLRFTGVSQRVRKNGHVVYESIFDEGIIRQEILYYNSRERDPVQRIFYHKEIVYVPQKKIRYFTNKKGEWEIISHFDENGEKILEEHLNNGELTLRSEFLNGKKHGTELCYDENGNKLVFQYQNGRKIK